MATVGKITIDLIARTQKLEAGFKRATKKANRYSRAIKKQESFLKNAGKAAAGYFSAAALGGIVKRNLELLDTTSKLARSLNTNTEALTEIRYAAAKMAGVEGPALDKAMEKMTVNIKKASLGGGEAKRALESIGLSVHDLAKMRPEEALEAIADGMNKTADANTNLTAAAALFGQRGAKLVGMLSKGSGELQKFRQEAVELGLSMSTTTAEGAEKANDAILRWVSQMDKGFQIMIGGITDVADALGLLEVPEEKMLQATKSSLAASEKRLAYLERTSHMLKQNTTDTWKMYRAIRKGTDEIERSANVLPSYIDMQVRLGKESGKIFPQKTLERMRAINDGLLKYKKAAADAVLGTQEDYRAKVALTEATVKAKNAIDALFEANTQNQEAIKQEDEITRQAAEGVKSWTNAYASLKQVVTGVTSDLQASAAANFATLQTSFSPGESQLDTLRTNMEEQLLIVEQYRLTHLEKTEEAAALEAQIKRKYEDETQEYLDRLRQSESEKRLGQMQTFTSSLMGFTSMMSNQSKAMFEVNKAVSIADAWVNTRVAATKAYAQGGVWGWASAAAIYAAGVAQIAAISATSPGSAGGGSSPSTSAPTSSISAGSGESQNINISISGNDVAARGLLQLLDVTAESGVTLKTLATQN